MLDLLDGTETGLDAITPPETVTTDGRYVFAADDAGVSIIDSGVWTWDHVDHFHYYRSQPRALPRLDGDGVATISTGMLSTAGSTGVFFPTSGEAVLLDNKALSQGELTETLRLTVDPHAGLIAPLGEGALVSRTGEGEKAIQVDAVDDAGTTLASHACEAASGSITTRVGLVVGCADGAVIATLDGDTPVLEHVPYPADAAAPATTFQARKGRPTVAGIGDGSGVWLLDTRESSWQWLKTSTPVVTATAVDDAGEHVVAVGEDGTIQVYDAGSGDSIGATKPLLASTLADPAVSGSVGVMVDGQRAYVNASAEGVVYEIDYADAARVARTLELATQPVHLMETGR
ncbi:lipoprotein [Kineosporia mesophila]|uniref:Lipoprotein n=2 Tax=Kineosporia mesophila TaxID=566012 RepID=A0ABP6Z456_9ACTN